MEAIEKSEIPQEEYLRRAIWAKEQGVKMEEIQTIAKEAEDAGDFEKAIQIKTDILHEFDTNDLRKKLSDKEVAAGHFKKAAEQISVVSGGEAARPIAELAEKAENYREAHEIYFTIIKDFEKDKEVLKKLSAQELENGNYLKAADCLSKLGSPKEEITALATTAEAKGNFEDATLIRENILGENSDKTKELRHQWEASRSK